jgi:hypothetical protein
MFMLFMWLMVCLAGSVLAGSIATATTTLTAELLSTDNTVYVHSTTGFPGAGVVNVGAETIAYSNKTTTTFYGTATKPLLRGTSGTTAATHAVGTHVYTSPASLLNSITAYNIIYLSDPEGVLAIVGVPIAFFQLLGGFFFLPLQFLGTDLQILSHLWIILAFGMIVALAVALVGRS